MKKNKLHINANSSVILLQEVSSFGRRVQNRVGVSKINAIKKVLILNFLFFFFGFSYAQNPVKMVADTTNIRIGEQIEYKITVDKQENVLFPKLVLDSLNKVEVVRELKIDTTETKFIKKYLLTSFDSGRYVIPRQKILINTKKYLTDSLLINVVTVKVDTTKQNLFPIKAVKNQPIIFDDYKNYLWIGLAILALLLFLLWYFVFRKKKEEIAIENKIPPYQLAVERLSVLDNKKLWQNNKIKQYYIELTDILRSYIESEYKIPALESTTDELIETIKDFNKSNTLDIPKESVKNLQKLLQEADLVKFAKFKPLSEEIELHRSDAEKIINNFNENKIEEKPEIQHCPITNEKGVIYIKLYCWYVPIIAFRLREKKVLVSEKGKELHLKKQSSFWRFFNPVGNVFMRIPFLGGYLILIWYLISIPIGIIVSILDLISRRKPLDRGILVLQRKGTVKIKSIDIKDEIVE